MAKTVLIFRGLARGRRETLINTMSKWYSATNVARIDTPQPNEYLSKDQLKDLAGNSFNQFKIEIAKGTELIIINNNNLKHHHYFSYLDYAQHYGYVVAVILVPWNDMSNRDLSLDSGGQVSVDKFQQYRKSFEWGNYDKVIEYKKQKRAAKASEVTPSE